MTEASRKKEDDDIFAAEEGCTGCCASWLQVIVVAVLSLLGYFTGFISLTTLGILLGIAVVIRFAAVPLYRWQHSRNIRMSKERQEQRNERARQTLLRLMYGQQPLRPLIVFLRPFKATREYRIWLGSLGVYSGYSQLPYSGGEFETSLAKLTAPFGDFVALGRDLQAQGAGRIETGKDEWRDIVRKICEAATAIIMFPSARPGTSWEAVLLKEQGYMRKTVFLMPPLVHQELPRSIARLARLSEEMPSEGMLGDSMRVTADGTVQTLNEHAIMDWEAACSKYVQFGISLPQFEDYGMAFLLEKDRKPVQISPLTARISEWRKFTDKRVQKELRIRIERIGQSLDTDWFPVWAAINAPANQHLLPLLSHLAYLVERAWFKSS